MKLSEARPGQRLRIVQIAEPSVRAQAIRFGLAEGATVFCSDVVPGGPVVLAKGTFQIAVGRRLASRISVAAIAPAAGPERRVNRPWL